MVGIASFLLWIGSWVASSIVAAAPVVHASPAQDALADARELLDSLRADRSRIGGEELRAALEELEELLTRAAAGEAEAEELVRLWGELGRLASEGGESELGLRAREAGLAQALARLPAEHALLADAREALAIELLWSAEQVRGLELLELVLLRRAAELPPEDPDLLELRKLVGLLRIGAGDLEGGLAESRVVLAAYERARPVDDEELLAQHMVVGLALVRTGELEEARRHLEIALEGRRRTLPADHLDLCFTRQNLAGLLGLLGDLRGARALEAEQLHALEGSRAPDDLELIEARARLALTLAELEEHDEALALQLAVLEARERLLPEEHQDLAITRTNLASLCLQRGEPARARALLERVLAVQERTLASDDPELVSTRSNLAAALGELGDLAGARALAEEVLARHERILTEDDESLQSTRWNLGAILLSLGESKRASELFEQLVASRSRTLPPEHHKLLFARTALAVALRVEGDAAAARSHLEQVISIAERELRPGNPSLGYARSELAELLHEQGELGRARALSESELATMRESRAEDDPAVQRQRTRLAAILASQVEAGELEREEGRALAVELGLGVARTEVRAARVLCLSSSVREAEERAARCDQNLARLISLAAGQGALGPLDELDEAVFVLSESARGAGLATAELMRASGSDPRQAALRAELAEAGAALASLAQEGATSAEFHAARGRREAAERALAALALELGTAGEIDVDIARLRALLGEDAVLVAWRSFERRELERVEGAESPAGARARPTRVPSLCAFVLSASEEGPVLVQLGPRAPIEEAVSAWREALGMRVERGIALGPDPGAELRRSGARVRELVLDPLLPWLRDRERLIAVPDDLLHLVPLDALPAPEGEGLVGDRWRVELRHTVWELARERSPAGASSGALVALGGAAFQSEPLGPGEEDPGRAAPRRERPDASPSRASAWERAFAPLTYSGPEAREIAALFAELFEGEAEALVLERRRASREALEAAAPRARFLHVATHGWFAPESIRSWSEVEEPGGGPSFDRRASVEVVRGLSPMLLCGLALAGANLPPDSQGRVSGLVTAEELSTFDLRRCELAVLSACDTNVGVRRAGQGVASLQKALHMAGARSVITSLWKVPDEATRELMLDFYRRLWVEQKPKHQALWEAKQRLRAAEDERGEPRYTTRDWAAWVLTGEPD